MTVKTLAELNRANRSFHDARSPTQREAWIKVTKTGRGVSWELRDEDGILEMGNADTPGEARNDAREWAKKLGRKFKENS